MGKFATRQVLRALCSLHGITIYRHRLDGVSYQYCAGGYVVNGYATRLPVEVIIYVMQKKLIMLLKYGDEADGGGDDDVRWYKERPYIEPLTKPLNGYGMGRIYTYRSIEADKELQEWFDLSNS